MLICVRTLKFLLRLALNSTNFELFFLSAVCSVTLCRPSSLGQWRRTLIFATDHVWKRNGVHRGAALNEGRDSSDIPRGTLQVVSI